MIDHVSIAVRDLEAGTRFYEAVLVPLGFSKLVVRAETVGFGKRYSEFWLNLRPDMAPRNPDDGAHVCLRGASSAAIDAFHAAALKAGGRSDGEPGLRPHYTANYYAAFIHDADGNKIEAVTFLTA